MIPLFSVSQIREADNYAINNLGIPGIVLMENASVSIFSIVKEKYLPDKNYPVGFVCGKGNNGGDGFAVARHFINDGFRVKVVHMGNEDEMTGDALTNFKILSKLIDNKSGSVLRKYKSLNDIRYLKDSSMLFDALLGTGTKGNLRSTYLEIVNELNKINTNRIAIDIPTGLDADTGFGEAIFNADLTVSLAELKRGLFFGNGAVFSGEIRKGYIGVPQKYFENFNVSDYLIEPEDVLNYLPKKEKDLHKYSAGKVVVLAG